MNMNVNRCFALLVFLVTVGGGECLGATERYNVDADHSIVGFSVAHMVISKTTGRFTDYTGFIEMDPDGKAVRSIEAVIKTASVDTNHQKRDTHLRAMDASHLFEPSTTRIGIRKNSYLRGYTYEFIEMFAPHLTRKVVDEAMHTKG